MAFTPVEIIALVFAIAVLLKIVIVLVNRDSYVSFAKTIYKSPKILMFAELVLAAIILYYLLMELSIVQIFAAIVLGALLTGVSFAVYAKEIMPAVLRAVKKDALKRAWLVIIVWLALMAWVLYALFM